MFIQRTVRKTLQAKCGTVEFSVAVACEGLRDGVAAHFDEVVKAVAAALPGAGDAEVGEPHVNDDVAVQGVSGIYDVTYSGPAYAFNAATGQFDSAVTGGPWPYQQGK